MNKDINRYDIFEKSLNNLINLNYLNRRDPEVKRAKLDLDLYTYASEFCTVKCDAGRRCGKTFYICKNANRESLAIVRSFTAGIRTYRSKITTFSVCSTEVDKTLIEDGIFKTIYIEYADHIFEIMPQEQLYNLLINPSIEQTFVLL